MLLRRSTIGRKAELKRTNKIFLKEFLWEDLVKVAQ